MKYIIESYDAEKDVAVVSFSFKFKGVDKSETLRAHGVPVDSKEAMDVFALYFVEAKKNELRQDKKVIATALKTKAEQTVVEKADPVVEPAK